MLAKRYERNLGLLTPEENESLKSAKVCVIGCGGLGGYIIEELARLGIGRITAADGDVFQESNLNRQLFSTETVLGKSKAQAAEERIHAVNSEVEIHTIHTFLTEENAAEIIEPDCQVVIDALDNITSRRILETYCCLNQIPLVHGAIAGWHGQVSVIMPGDKVFDQLYPADADRGAELETGNPAFTPAVVASIQVSEALKIILGREGVLRKKLLTIDLLEHEYDVIEL